MTVEKVLSILECAIPGTRARVKVAREEAKPEIKGLKGNVWIDEMRYSEEIA